MSKVSPLQATLTVWHSWLSKWPRISGATWERRMTGVAGISGYRWEQRGTQFTRLKSNDKNINLFFDISALKLLVVFCHLVFKQVKKLKAPFTSAARAWKSIWIMLPFLQLVLIPHLFLLSCTLDAMMLNPDFINCEAKLLNLKTCLKRYHPQRPDFWIRPRFL